MMWSDKKTPQGFLPGFWSGDIEQQAALRVAQLPDVFRNPEIARDSFYLPESDAILKTIHKNMSGLLSVIFGDRPCPVTLLKVKKICGLDLIHKKKEAITLPIMLYHLTIDHKKTQNIHMIFCLDEDKQVLGYVRFHFKLRSDATSDAYNGAQFSIEGIESYVRNQYSLGTVLIQAALEFLLTAGFDGKLSAYSIANSAQFYHKLGFTPFDETALGYLLVGHSKDMLLMFLTEPAIAAWNERITQSPLFLQLPAASLSSPKPPQ